MTVTVVADVVSLRILDRDADEMLTVNAVDGNGDLLSRAC